MWFGTHDRNFERDEKMSCPRTCVLMSTYNGEKYIREQIESILNQKNVEIELLIRDDGSTDNTACICKEYEVKEKNIHFYQGKNIGVGNSFLDLIQNAPDTDYYAFSDQDDVWLEDKLEKSIKGIEDELGNKNKAVLYTSNQIVVDSELNIIGMRFEEEPKHDLFNTVCENKLSGCTMTFNKCLKDIILQLHLEDYEITLKQRLHDTWCIIVANIVGKVIYDKEGRILYRQHENNVVGANDHLDNHKIKMNKIKKLFNRDKRNFRSNTSCSIVRCFPFVSDERIQLLSNSRHINGKVSLIRNRELFLDIYKCHTFIVYVLCGFL